jgi:histone H3/H4
MIPTFAPFTQVASNLPSDASALERSISALESCISALDNAAESLGNSSASLEPWSWVFTALVALGVAMEFWVIWHEHRENTETWALTFFGINRTLRPSFGRLLVEYVSVALVAGGIIGELVVGIKIASLNHQLRGVDAQLRSKNGELRSKSDQLLAFVTQEAGDAAASAKTALVSAKDVGRLEKHLRIDSASEELLLAAQETHRQVLPIIFNSLSEGTPAKVQIECFMYGNSGMFARALATSFKSFGWKVTPIVWEQLVPGGITISNKWVSREAVLVGSYIGVPGNEDWELIKRDVMEEHPEIPKSDVERLVKLAVALRAKLQRKPSLDENSLEILIGATAK